MEFKAGSGPNVPNITPSSTSSTSSSAITNNVSPITGRLTGQQILDRGRNFNQLIVVKAKSIRKFRFAFENGNEKAIENVALTEVFFFFKLFILIFLLFL